MLCSFHTTFGLAGGIKKIIWGHNVYQTPSIADRGRYPIGHKNLNFFLKITAPY